MALLLMAFALLLQATAAPPRDGPPGTTGAGNAQHPLHGVVLTDAGEPVGGARVTVSRDDSTPYLTTVTDASGAWRFDGLTSGRYSVSVSKTGFIARSRRKALGQTDGMFDLSARGQPGPLTIRLVRGAAIAGRVVDGHAEPVAHVRVQALRRALMLGQSMLQDAGRGTTTDDRGEFRLFDLPAGDYLVEATLDGPAAAGRDVEGLSTVSTFYPGVTRASEAQTVTVAAGSEASGLIIALQTARTMTVTGRLRSGCEHAFLMLVPGGPAELPSRSGVKTASAGRDGRFAIQGVLPGEYTLHARAECDNQTHEAGRFPITVADADLNGLTLTIAPPAPVRGRVVLESPLPGRMTINALKVIAYPGGPPSFSLDSVDSAIQPDGAFAFTTGAAQLALSVEPLPPGWFVKSVSRRGVEAEPDGLPVSGPTDGVEILLSGRAGRITGTVLAADSPDEPEDTMVLIFHEDRRRWGRFSKYTRVESADSFGRFDVWSLPPGDYLAVAVVSGDDYPDENTFERFRPIATPVAVGESQTSTVSLKAVDAR